MDYGARRRVRTHGGRMMGVHRLTRARRCVRAREEAECVARVRIEEPPCEAPDVRIEVRVRAGQSHSVAVWHEEEAEGRQRVWELTPSQYEAYRLLLEAGDRQLLTFLSGEDILA